MIHNHSIDLRQMQFLKYLMVFILLYGTLQARLKDRMVHSKGELRKMQIGSLMEKVP